MNPTAVEALPLWRACAPDPLAWIGWRESLLTVLHTPVSFLPLAAVFAVALAWRLRFPRPVLLAVGLVTPLVLSSIYRSAATTWLSDWLIAQVPSADTGSSGQPVAVLLGRGPTIPAATTRVATARYRQGKAVVVYVSGDLPATGDLLVRQGIPPERVAGDSCARTTWENATLTATWLRQHHPSAAVLLITDPWQLARATRAFQRQGLQVIPLVAEPLLSPVERNRLALRESAAIALYRQQG